MAWEDIFWYINSNIDLQWLLSTQKLRAMWYVYIIKCSNNTYYTGCTNSLEDRKARHRKGLIHYTKDKLPVELITYTAFSTDRYKSFEFEKMPEIRFGNSIHE
jgi:predicted GIY-YIG superfamily endonuclease